MQSTMLESSPRDLAGVTTGALVLTCFGAIWGLQGPRIMLIITPVVTVALLGLYFTTRPMLRRLPEEKEAPEDQDQGAMRFGMVVGIEFLSIIVAIVLLRFFKHTEFIAPVICFIVGLHFLPLASLFGVRAYALVGIALSLLGGGAMLALLFGWTLGDLFTWSVIVALGTAALFWFTAFFILVKVRRVLYLLRQSQEDSATPKQH